MNIPAQRMLQALTAAVYLFLAVAASVTTSAGLLVMPILIGLAVALAAGIYLLTPSPKSDRILLSAWSLQALASLSYALFAPWAGGLRSIALVWPGIQLMLCHQDRLGWWLTAGWGLAAEAGLYFEVIPAAGTANLDPLLFPSLYLFLTGMTILLTRQRNLRTRDLATLNQSRETAALLAQANLRLQEYAIQDHQMAIMAERNRMAREIHDTLGHTLTSILVQLGALSVMSYTQRELIPQQVESIRQTISQGQMEVRSAIEALNAPAQQLPHGRPYWERVAVAFAETTGVMVDLWIAEDYEWISDAINEAVYRIIQEGLTNSVRHGQASRVEISIHAEDGFLLLRISDDGRGAPHLVEGHGLQGMRERLAALGGEIDYSNKPGIGFDLGIDIPLQTPVQGFDAGGKEAKTWTG